MEVHCGGFERFYWNFLPKKKEKKRKCHCCHVEGKFLQTPNPKNSNVWFSAVISFFLANLFGICVNINQCSTFEDNIRVNYYISESLILLIWSVLESRSSTKSWGLSSKADNIILIWS